MFLLNHIFDYWPRLEPARKHQAGAAHRLFAVQREIIRFYSHRLAPNGSDGVLGSHAWQGRVPRYRWNSVL